MEHSAQDGRNEKEGLMKETAASAAVVIPAYNEEQAIIEIIQRVRAAAPSLPIVVVDDGSTDGTAGAARQAGATVLRHPKNKGNGAAVKTAMRSLEVDNLVVIDADGQHPPEAIPELLEQLEHFDLVIGARTQDSASALSRRFGNYVLRRLAEYLLGVEVKDLTSGFRAFNRQKALEFQHLYPNKFSFPTTITLSFFHAGYDVEFHPIKGEQRKLGTKSKIRPIRDALKFMAIILRIATMSHPLRIFFPVGGAIFLIGIAWILRNLVSFSSVSILGGMLFIVGLNIIFFGIVVDQLATMNLRRRD
jgi:glycosyltransferase involved in cell wall biosynthesis